MNLFDQKEINNQYPATVPGGTHKIYRDPLNQQVHASAPTEGTTWQRWQLVPRPGSSLFHVSTSQEAQNSIPFHRWKLIGPRNLPSLHKVFICILSKCTICEVVLVNSYWLKIDFIIKVIIKNVMNTKCKTTTSMANWIWPLAYTSIREYAADAIT